jgi:nucleoside-diphosphate-sugar epimerase
VRTGTSPTGGCRRKFTADELREKGTEMKPLSVLFVGGTGRISSACVVRAIERGFDVSVLNRNQTSVRPLPKEVTRLTADIRDVVAVREALGGRHFDAIADFTIFDPAQVTTDIEVFAGRTGQFIFISSASAYQKPIAHLPITESTPLVNPYWEYSRDKIACEERLLSAYREDGFPVTIVRPSHTYDRTGLPFNGRWTVVHRMRLGKPVVVHGDGTSLWVLTHHDDFARAFVRLLANPLAIGDTFHITSDEVLTWDQIHRLVARAAGVAEPHLVHVASETIAKVLPEWGPPILGDKAHSVIFDNSKIRALAPGWTATIPFSDGAREIIEWLDSQPSEQVVDETVDKAFDVLAEQYC